MAFLEFQDSADCCPGSEGLGTDWTGRSGVEGVRSGDAGWGLSVRHAGIAGSEDETKAGNSVGSKGSDWPVNGDSVGEIVVEGRRDDGDGAIEGDGADLGSPVGDAGLVGSGTERLGRDSVDGDDGAGLEFASHKVSVEIRGR